MSHAFYVPAEKWGAFMILEDKEAAHAHVLRLKRGDSVFALDGKGRTGECVIKGMPKKKLELELRQEYFTQPPNSRPVLALALSKAVRRGFFMEKATELGAWEIWLWQADHSQGKLTPAVMESCRAQLIAGLKQSRNPWLPRTEIRDNATSVANASKNADYRIMPWEARAGIPMLLENQLGRAGMTVYVIGPEGGFSAKEVDIFKNAAFEPVSLGNRILRCETAAMLCLGLHCWAARLPGHCDFQTEADPGNE